MLFRSDDPAPHCTVCGGEVGIFVRYSLNWQHYQTTGEGSLELFDPGHEPDVAWRTAPGESYPRVRHRPGFPAVVLI